MNEYLENILPSGPENLIAVKEYARKNKVPIIRDDCEAFIKVMLKVLNPSRILEIGTAIGYSSMMMATVLPQVHIDTVEIDLSVAAQALNNIKLQGLDDRIRVITGDGGEVMEALHRPYDMIFLDAAKGQYMHLYDDAKRLLNPGGVLLCDNCIFYGKIYTAPQDAPRKHRTIVTNMRAFLERFLNDPDFTATLLEVGDGVAVGVKNRQEAEK